MIENQTDQQLNEISSDGKIASKIDIILGKIPQPVKEIFTKFYSNKRIFWPVTGAVGAVLLILILGLLFGKKQASVSSTKPAPAPAQSQTVSAPSTPDQLQQIQITLGKIKDQISNFDAGQATLTPPSINFKISF